jgi:hypothetical protein
MQLETERLINHATRVAQEWVELNGFLEGAIIHARSPSGIIFIRLWEPEKSIQQYPSLMAELVREGLPEFTLTFEENNLDNSYLYMSYFSPSEEITWRSTVNQSLNGGTTVSCWKQVPTRSEFRQIYQRYSPFLWN